MECVDSSTSTNTTDVDSVLISVTDNNLRNEETMIEKEVDDLSNLDNLEILNTCEGRDLYNPKMMDCLSDFPENFDINIPPIENVDSVLPMYGPYPEFESQSSFETDVVDPHAVPGVCGLRNLGNTCFMNAGLQCLLNNKIFKNYFSDRELDSFVKGTLTFKFAEIMKKFWSGTYSTLHLGEFKECFGAMHNQFRNFRQHDCQEFLALLLDSMHEEINAASKRSKAECTQLQNNVSEDNTVQNKIFEGDSDFDKKMDICEKEDKPEKIFDSSSPETSEQSLSDSGSITGDVTNPEPTNNVKILNRTFEIIRKKNSTEFTPGLFEQNTEKMADLLINNNKLDKILNKNELDVTHNSKESDFLKVKSAEENRTLSVNKLEKNELACKFNTARKIPSIEDFVKDTKTLNTNVLVSDETNNLFKFDSEKFPKHEPNRLQETVDNLGQIVDLGVKQGGLKRVKITNLVHEKHKILENSCHSSCSGLHKRLKMENMETNLDSPVPEQDDAVEMEPLPCDEYSEGSSQSSELYALNTECRGLLLADEIRRAYSHWDQYKLLNQSVIVDTFHGQFRSSVVCSQCSHNSITYEPFMYLPVFLPHALERQIVITFVQNNGTTPICYLVNVNKFDRIHKIREALQRLLDVTPEEIILAEVFENHISRILDENQCIRRVNDASRSVYAFEVGKISEQNSDSPKNSNAAPLSFTDESQDLNKYSDNSCLFKNSKNNDDEFQIHEGCSSPKCSNSPVDVKPDDNQTDKNCSEFDPSANSIQQNSLLTFIGSLQRRSCAICLEDYPDYNLSMHPHCECILCSHCIEVSCKHYGSGSFICPVCTASVSPTEDFVPLSKIGEYQFKINSIPVPILMRHDSFEDGVLKEKILIGHPGLLKLPSTLSAAKLYEHVDNAIPFLSTYSLLLVDGQGKNCSRCLYSEHCSGCEIARSGDIKLCSGDNIAVRYTDLSAESLAAASAVTEHKSMQQTRHKPDLDIYDCLEYFSERESLDEDSPWFCPVCRQNQQATKSLSVWKFPEVLIICLKRFVFHDFVSIKVEDKVTYPLEGLNLSSFSTGPYTGELIYDLQACVCHFGGVSAGHYTSYSKHAVTSEWYHHNDENVKKEIPNTDDSVSEYILFYQRR